LHRDNHRCAFTRALDKDLVTPESIRSEPKVILANVAHIISQSLSQPINISGSSTATAMEDPKVLIFSSYHMVFAS
jgi:hypothetical protein